jgi:hypothetical protein
MTIHFLGSFLLHSRCGIPSGCLGGLGLIPRVFDQVFDHGLIYVTPLESKLGSANLRRSVGTSGFGGELPRPRGRSRSTWAVESSAPWAWRFARERIGGDRMCCVLERGREVWVLRLAQPALSIGFTAKWSSGKSLRLMAVARHHPLSIPFTFHSRISNNAR